VVSGSGFDEYLAGLYGKTLAYAALGGGGRGRGERMDDFVKKGKKFEKSGKSQESRTDQLRGTLTGAGSGWEW